MEKIRTYHKTPPQSFQDVAVAQANTYYVISNARFEGNELVADRVQQRHGTGWESLNSMLDGLEIGFKAALPKPTPWSITYNAHTVHPQYKGMTERAIFEARQLDYYHDDLPASVFKTKVVIEKFASSKEAQDRIDELHARPWPNNNHNANAVYDQDAQVLF